MRERTNIRNLRSEELYKSYEPRASLAVADLSFISLRLVLPALRSLLLPENAEALLLVKPQFEVGRNRVGKGGVVRDESAHIEILQSIILEASYQKWEPQGIVPSPITGPAGNHEYLLWLGSNKGNNLLDIKEIVANTLS